LKRRSLAVAARVVPVVLRLVVLPRAVLRKAVVRVEAVVE
jgi:hypothetical protein